jgi:hypothetical protein
MLVCGIELDMLVPTVEKKLLKALDISKLSVVEAPFIDISEMEELVGLRLAASLSNCQVLRGFLLELAKLFS